MAQNNANTFWIESVPDDGSAAHRLGVTEAYIEDLPGGLVGIELLNAGTRVEAGETFGFIHSAERTHDLRAPCALQIVAVNQEALADPRLVSASPHLRGWLIDFIT